MIFNSSTIERSRHQQCIFGSIAVQLRYIGVQLWYMRPALLPDATAAHLVNKLAAAVERLYCTIRNTDNKAVCSGVSSHDEIMKHSKNNYNKLHCRHWRLCDD